MADTAKNRKAEAAPASVAEPHADEAARQQQAEVEAALHEGVVEAAANAEGETPDNPRLSVEELMANSRALTGYPDHVLAGALHDFTGENLTVKQAIARIEKDQNREVEVS